MSKLPTPRPFQQKALDTIASSDCNRILLSAPTGGGKAILFMMIADAKLLAGKSVLLLVDRITLVKQLSDTATNCGLTHNIIQGSKNIDNGSQFTIGSIQTLFRAGNIIANYDVILVDECHTQYNALIEYLKTYNGLVIGATATPYTSGLGNVYKTIINCATAHQLTTNGTLVKLLPYTFRKIDMKGAKTIGGEWAANEVHKRSRVIYGDVVATYKKAIMGMRSICFCATVAHCEEVAAEFNANGVSAGVFTGKTTETERTKLLDDFDNSRILVLISVSALAKGFDKPYVECILDLRPLRRSLSEYVQMIGRGLRSNLGKKECYLLDFTGNIDRFLPDFENVYYNGVDSLDMSEKLNRVRTDKESKNAISCPVCDNLYMHTKCTNCGYVKPMATTPVIVELENVELQSVEIFGDRPQPLMNVGEMKTNKKPTPFNFLGKLKQVFSSF